MVLSKKGLRTGQITVYKNCPGRPFLCLVIFAETLSGFLEKKLPKADLPKTFGFRRRPGSESLQKEGTGGSLMNLNFF
jgi:hypothetical protein